MPSISISNKLNLISKASLCSLGFLIFSYFIHYEFPARGLSFFGLAISAFIISRNLISPLQLGWEFKSGLRTLSYTIPGLIMGLLLAYFYRNYLGQELLPKSLHKFAIAAAIIGSTEELVFRGYIQKWVQPVNVPLSIVFGALAHTGYKCFLFVSPPAGTDINILFLFQWTFAIGLIFGITRYLTKSILPAMTAHAFFDILVYGEFAAAPWWVW
jgi:membrane protease YdiL (CAAX protease family)